MFVQRMLLYTICVLDAELLICQHQRIVSFSKRVNRLTIKWVAYVDDTIYYNVDNILL